jgi:2-methylisocitrate lyase-like PEP mutase family enzyme
MRRKFRERVEKGPIVVAAGVYDAFSAKLAAYAGCEALYMTGAGVSAGLIGMPDLGVTTQTEMVEQARRILEAVELPLISDADTGYGGPLNVRRTVQLFEGAGVSAIHLEDQEIPKRCGHLEGKRVVPPREMAGRLKAALDARRDPNFLIIARTDARAVNGLEDALDRGRLYAETGADVIFIEAPESLSELEAIVKALPQKPLLLNRGGGGKTPALSAQELDRLGYRIVIFPGDAQKAAGAAMLHVYRTLRDTGNTKGLSMLGFEERFEILGLSRLRELEEEYLAGS